MPVYNFGVGTLIGRRTDITNPTPVRFGVLQEVTISMAGKNEKLVGQNQMPVDIARGELDITCKSKFARIQASAFNDLFFGQTVTPASGEQLAVDESATIPATPFHITVTNAATFKADMGVFYQSSGVQLGRVAGGSEATGLYSVNEGTGVYTFSTGDTAAVVLITYRYGVTTMKQITMVNQLMGASPTFEINLQERYQNTGLVLGTPFVRLTACKSSKLELPMMNTKYTIPNFDFDVFADQTNTWGVWSFNE
jgi:hypothetical protein